MDQTTGSNKMTIGQTNVPARSKPVNTGDRSIEEIRHNIEQTRNEITDTVDKLGERLKETVDWRSYVTEHPFVAVGGAALLGFIVTRKLLATKKRNPTEELMHDLLSTARNAFSPKRQSLFITVATLAGKYALDQFQQYRAEQDQQRQQQEQIEAFQAYQQMLHNQMSGNVTDNPLPERHRVAGSDL